MKIKKLACLAAAAVMAFSAVSASALSVPTPKNNEEAYSFTKQFYNDGYYYEALDELKMVDVDDIYYEPTKQAEWMEKVVTKINEWEAKQRAIADKKAYAADRAAMKQLFADVTKLNKELKFEDALNLLYTAQNYTVAEYEYILWWEDALISNMNNPKYQTTAGNPVIVKTKADAIWVVQKNGGVVNSNDEGYYAAKSGVSGYAYDVYVYTKLPGGGRADVAAFCVAADGSLIRVK